MFCSDRPVSRKNLPYIDAILKETLRFHPIVPMSIPYMCLEDYPYRGMILLRLRLLILKFL